MKAVESIRAVSALLMLCSVRQAAPLLTGTGLFHDVDRLVGEAKDRFIAFSLVRFAPPQLVLPKLS